MKWIYSNKWGNCDRSEGGSWEGRREVSVLFSQTADIPSSLQQPKWTYLSNKGSQNFLNSEKVVGQNSWKLVTAGWVALDALDTAPNTVPYLWVAGCSNPWQCICGSVCHMWWAGQTVIVQVHGGVSQHCTWNVVSHLPSCILLLPHCFSMLGADARMEV